ncbi:Na+/H+ antiporter NhaA [Rhizobium sp. TH2]|uniref:Na+/H+ antiporter NhaA n=1 Tax=Rhizobium sp. TH2 TaxID=2775403 RepID=UPI002157CFD2|nr:Na+/H+ antiporter NhaA [Rhizobium sp. TH2]UVC08247.1 Na+/H+ antiporter NhaA [Rhizobium sp. TH2]
MSSPASKGRIPSTLRSFLDNEASSGLILMAVAALALVTANSPLAATYFHALHVYIGPLSVLHWVNDALMALFFLLVGLEIKREMLDGQLSSWPRRILPGGAALGGMVAPALVYAWFNGGNPATAHGWAIPAATDIAFALGVLSLLGPRVPVTLKVFLTALAIIDDLGAVVIIAFFYTGGLNLLALGGAAVVVVLLIVLNRMRVNHLVPYLGLGLVLWILVFMSGVHATIAGVLLALTFPIKITPGTPEASEADSPLHRLEHLLHKPVSFLVVPIFGFANAGLSFSGVGLAAMLEPVTLGVGLGLFVGKIVGVLGSVWLMVRAGIADLPGSASWRQMTGVALLCGIGFTMSLFVALLAFHDPAAQDEAKLGIILGSTVAALAGCFVLMGSERRPRAEVS